MDPTAALPKGAKSKVKKTPGGAEVLVHSVNEVYIYIPAEISAAGYELKIKGSVKIVDKKNEFYLVWSPNDLTQQDVACLYSAQQDSWTVVEKIEPPEIIDIQELQHPKKDYPGESLELPESILPPPSSPTDQRVKVGSPTGASAVKVDQVGNVTFSKNGDKGVVAGFDGTSESVDFSLSSLHSVRLGKGSLTFFLKTGVELPTLHFHDGGTSGLFQALQRYIYLEKDPHLPYFYYCKDYDKAKKPKTGSPSAPKELAEGEPPQFKHITPSNFKGSKANEVQELIQGVVGNFVGITRAVRQHLMPEKQLLDTRPGTENDPDELEETIQTCVLSDVRPGSSPSPTPPSSPPTTEGQSSREPPRKSPATRPRSASNKSTDPEASLITDYQLITDIRGKLPPRPERTPRQPPVTQDEWERLRDDSGRIVADMEHHFRARVFAGGISNTLRKEAWKYLLRYYPFDLTDLERMELREKKEKEYWIMKQQWQAFTPDQESRFQRWREVKCLINKDVLRTDRDYDMYHSVSNPKLQQLEDILRTYTMYNFDLGYVQGMSDLLAPLLVVMDNEVDAFWCFVGFMDMVQHHFEMSQEGMRVRLKQLRALLNIIDPELYQFLKMKESNNLYFCFRWLIVHFKRELVYDDIMALWEVCWTNFLSPDFPLFVALAILTTERDSLMNPRYDFSDILQHVNSLSKCMNLPPILELAESLCYQLGSSKHLPDDLQTLIATKPLPSRVPLSSVPQAADDTVICSPDSRAVPTSQSQ